MAEDELCKKFGIPMARKPHKEYYEDIQDREDRLHLEKMERIKQAEEEAKSNFAVS